MNILIANNFYAPQVIGGAELSVQGIAEQLARLGNRVAVLTTGTHDETTVLNGVTVCRRRFDALMSYQEHLDSPLSPKKFLNKALTIDNPSNARTVAPLLRRQKPDVVLSNNLLGITTELWRTARREGIPVVHTLRDYALLCPNSTLTCPSHPGCSDKPKLWCAAMRRRMRRVSGTVDTVAAPSRYTLEMHLKKGLFCGSRSRVVPNAVVFDPKKVREAMDLRRHDRRDHPLRIAYLGRLVEEKGVSVLLRTLELLEKDCAVEIHFAGKGPLEEMLAASREKGLPIHLHGFLSQDDVHALLMRCDVLVAPSVWPEPFGRVVLDAYVHAMPVVVSDAGGLPEVLAPGAGMVVEAGDAYGLRDALLCYAQDRMRVVEDGLAGAEQTRRFTVERQTDAFLEELKRLV